MVDVKGKWALITGANRGIGYLTATYMAEQGCNLILHVRSLPHAEKVLSKVKELGVEAYVVSAELSDIGAVNAMLDEIEEKETQVDIVFNNAGVQIAYREDYFSTPVEDYTKSFLVNTVAVMTICYRLLPPMIKRGFGRVINTTSGIKNEPEQAGYSASKAALDKVTKDLGSKLEGTDVIISLVDPGWCRTELGGPNAPNAPASALPGVVVGAFVDDKKSGRLFEAQLFSGLSLEKAIVKAKSL